MLGFLAFSVALWLALDARAHRGRARAARIAGVLAALALGAFSVASFALWTKVIARLLLPAGLVFCALWVATIIALHTGRRRMAAAAGAALLLQVVAGNAWLGETLLARLEAPYIAAVPDPMQEGPFDAVFVLGGGTTIDDTGRVYLSRAGDRLVLGARLWHAGRTPTLVTSGGSPPGSGQPRNAAAETTLMWTQLGVPEEAIVQLPEPWNTSRELAAYRELIDERGWERVGIISSAWHLRRVEVHMTRQGIEATLLPADVRGAPFWNGFDSFVPVGPGFDVVHRGCWEYLGALVGR